MNSQVIRPTSSRSARTFFALELVTAFDAVVYLLAATLHLGVKVPLGSATLGFPQPIPAASVAEGLIGAVLGAAAAALVARGEPARGWAWRAYAFALVGTLFGLTIVILRQLGGPDLGVHFVMLAGLATGFALLAITRMG
jgi:hypothetical protein